GDEGLDPDVNLVVKLEPEVRPKAPYATLDLPFPSMVTSMLRAEFSSDKFTIDDELVNPRPTQIISTLQVFTYEIEDLDALSLRADDGDGHYWEPSPVASPAGNFVNLHVFSAEDHYHKPSHAKEDLNLCLELLPGVETRL